MEPLISDKLKVYLCHLSLVSKCPKQKIKINEKVAYFLPRIIETDFINISVFILSFKCAIMRL